MSATLITELKDGVMTLTLNRPTVFNSFNLEMGRAFQAALDEAASNDDVRCVVITGEGRAFCAGQDLNEVTADSSPGFKVIVEETYNRSIRRICGMENQSWLRSMEWLQVREPTSPWPATSSWPNLPPSLSKPSRTSG